MQTYYRKALRILCLCLPLSTAYSPQSAAGVEVITDADSGLVSWKAQHPGLSLQFIQVLPDYIRASYSARGLPAVFVEMMAKQCVFGTIIKNESGKTLSYRVADWRYITADGRAHSIKTKTQWLEEWAEMGVIFRWSLLPDEQQFAPGDWSQGFTTLPLAPETAITIHYSWTEDGKTHEGVFNDLRCAPAQAPAL